MATYRWASTVTTYVVPVRWVAAKDSGIILIPGWVISLSGLVILMAVPKLDEVVSLFHSAD